MSNQVADSTASNPAVSTAERMSQNYSINDIASFLELDVDSVRYILAGVTRNAVTGELSVRHDRHFKSMPHDYRKWEVKRIKNLVSSKATIRYIMEVK